MTTSPAPDVDRVLDRMGRSAFGYRSFPKSDEQAGPSHDAIPAMPAAPAPHAASALIRFPLIAEALPASAAEAAPPQAHTTTHTATQLAAPMAAAMAPAATASVAASAATAVAPPPAPRLAPMPPPHAASSPALPNPFLPHAPAAPPPLAAANTPLTGMFRLLSGRADAARTQMNGSARAHDDAGARAPAFPFRHG